MTSIVKTPMFIAMLNDRYEAFKLLLKHIIHIDYTQLIHTIIRCNDIKYEGGYLPLSIRRHNYIRDIYIEDLLDYVTDVNEVHGGLDLLELTLECEWCSDRLIEKIIDIGAIVDASHLHDAIRNNRINIVRMMLKYNIDVSEGSYLITAANNCNIEMIELLLDHGVRTDVIDEHGLTPLEIVSMHADKRTKKYRHIQQLLS